MAKANMKGRIAYFTICARNYLAYALNLQESLLAADETLDFYIFLADEAVPGQQPDANVILSSAIGIDRHDEMTFRYTVTEFATAIKPSCFQHLMNDWGYSAAVYLDPDIQVFKKLNEVESAISEGASCILTPHLLQPLKDKGQPSDIDILSSGTFNLGFAAFSKTKEAKDFISWWAKTLETQCLIDTESGLFVDQKFVDFAPSFIGNTKILRHPGYNVAYWNLANRNVRKQSNGWFVGDTNLVFFHFSGVNPSDNSVISKHQNRFSRENCGDTKLLIDQYLNNLDRHNNEYWSNLPYAYGYFQSGEPIPQTLRRGPPANKENPFAGPNLEYWNAPSERIDQDIDYAFTRFMVAVHSKRQDLRDTFSLSTRTGRVAFRNWFARNAESQCNAFEALTTPDNVQSETRQRTLSRVWLKIGQLLKLI